MKKICIIALALLLQAAYRTATGQTRPEAEDGENAVQADLRRQTFDFDWKFYLGEAEEAVAPGYDDSRWEDIQLPHDWSVCHPFDSTISRGWDMGFLPGGTGWYRKTFHLPAACKGRTVSVLFDGVYHQSNVYINGKNLGFHPYGYTGFEYDLTPYLKYGADNVLTVRVDHSDSPTSRWYSGSGIYRHVWLTVTRPVRIATWGTCVTAPRITDASADVRIQTTVENHTSARQSVTLESRVLDPLGNVVQTVSSSSDIPKKRSADIEQLVAVGQPQRWSIHTPRLYRLLSIVRINGEEADRCETPFGIREIRYDPDRGFFLNGENIKMKGVNIHQDAGSLGVAMPDRAHERRLEILKEYGCNAIRCSHNPPAPEFLDLCDRLGFLVIDEALDKWKSGYYAKYFDEWWQKDLSAMLLRDRNHPSIVMWSIGNEVDEQNDTTGVGKARAKMLQDYVHRVEPTRPVMVAIAPGGEWNPNSSMMRPYNRSGFNETLDIVGYNYQEPWYVDDKKAFPNRIMFGAEVFTYYRGRKENMRGYFPVNPWYDVVKNDFIFGQFIWAGIDYLGECYRWPAKGWPGGLFDVCMFEKSRAAFHRSVWNDRPAVRIAVADQSLQLPLVKDHWSWPHLVSHWNFPQYLDQVIEVQTVTNCESVELWTSSFAFGRRYTADYANNTIVWHVPYKAGKIWAKGYNGDAEVASCELQTSGKPSRIVLAADREMLSADGQDLSHITVLLVDDHGIVVPDSDVQITFEVTGNGRLIGLDNGNLMSDEMLKGNKRTTYFGKALAIVRSSRKEGTIAVKATAPGLPESTLTIKSRK
ncbi:MAG: DUF4982 domain-containing protein [Tannerella sp.]|jgi:beta-galactosidase|nr:DUF4982 domain-containing protein [Tannerella sp.]